MLSERCTPDEGPFDLVSEDALLLSEFSHRTANEIAAAAAALHLAKRASPAGGSRLLDEAAGRLEAFGEIHRLLARPMRARSDAGAELTAVCRAITSASPGAARSVVSLAVVETWTTGRMARRLAVIAAELVANAVRHALDGRAGRLDVSLLAAGRDLVLRVADDGPGMRVGASTSGTGLGGGIVRQLVQRAGGTLAIETGRVGTVVRVTLPLGQSSDEAGDVVF